MSPLMLIRLAPWGLAGVLAVAAGIQTVRLADARTDAAETAAGHALALAEKESQARARERQHVADLDGIATQYQQEQARAKSHVDRLTADLAAGTQRVRHTLTCPRTTVVPSAGASAGTADDRAGLLPADVGVLVGLASECDGRIRALQAVTRSDRE